MATEVKLPRLGQGMEAGTIVKWLKSEGEPVAKGEPLYELDTDKVTQEVEAETDGVLLKIAVASGEAAVGTTIAVIGNEGEEVAVEAGPPAGAEESPDAPKSKRSADAPEPKESAELAGPESAEPPRSESAEPAPSESDEPARSESASSRTNGRLKASPLARRIARERNLDLAQITGTGPDGRIVAEDVERAAAAPPRTDAPARTDATALPGEIETVPLTSIRRTVARRLTAAWQAPAFQLTVSVDMTRANELVARSRELNPDLQITVTDVLVKLCAVALVRHRDVNVQYAEDSLKIFPTANVGIAVAAPQGLVVPVVRSAEQLSLVELAQARADVVGRARDNKLRQGDLEGGTFTISNLGMFGVEQFVAVLNPPQAAILAVGATEERAVVRGGAVVVRPMLTLTLTVDHRAVDGAQGADFLRTVKTYLEDPALAL
ncbi:MAG TPA: dihydrolipoamide acetyltransferase family protein [Gaiellaceae bacterium]|nr:dihydrolipoamide acetyltransferase family protein [Gaiellaceae bacterium]